jgi:DNA polymerase I
MLSGGHNLITTRESLSRAVEVLSASRVVGFDLETTGLDPYSTQPRLIQLATSDLCYVIDLFRFNREDLQPVLSLLADRALLKVAHNAKFDAKFLLHHYGVRLSSLFDTCLASQLVSAGADERHGLEPVAQRYLNVQLDKLLQVSDWSGELSEAQIEYAANDAAVMLPLRLALQRRLAELGLSEVAELEFQCVMALTAMELAGVALDANLWRGQVKRTRQAHAAVAAELQDELAAGATQMMLFEDRGRINLDSITQVREALSRLGIEIESTREWMLQKLAREHRVVKLLLEYRVLSKSLAAYGEGMIDYINPVTGRIHADFRQIGTPTGRITCSSPSLQQVPHSADYRMCFRAPEGRKLVIADYSQIEMRVLADLAEDEALLRAFDSGADLHRATASRMLGVALETVTAAQRAMAKGLNYGIIYGMGAEGLAMRIESTVPEAENLIGQYFRAYPAVSAWLRDAANRAVREGRTRSASGRLWVFNLDPSDRQQQGALARVGRNAPIQGTASDIFKRAMRLVDEALSGTDARVINSIHDEIVVECSPETATRTATSVSNAMKEAAHGFLKRVPVEVETLVSDAWLKT